MKTDTNENTHLSRATEFGQNVMRRYATVCVVLMLLCAGCIGGQGGTTTSPVPGDTETTTTAETTESAGGASAVDFYLSDEQNAMDDFAHLNVTISEVGMKRADGNWTTHEVDQRTVDLTRLLGANATRLGSFDVENGTYETVFVHVSEVNGTLTNGEEVRVKLPSEKLQIHQSFAVGANESVDYVFDISVFKAGNSGKYILKPIISESGTDKEIEDIDERESEKGEDEKGEDEKGEDGKDEKEQNDKTDLNATFVNNVTRGENVTISVTQNGSAVANATVSVNDESVGVTAADGTLTFSVPDAEELEVEIETERASAELEREFEPDDSDDETTTA